MERKINKEIREYREAMFWGLTLRQFFFSVLGLAYLSGYIFCCGKARHGSCVMGVYLRDATLRDARLCDLQQNARREIPLGSD